MRKFLYALIGLAGLLYPTTDSLAACTAGQPPAGTVCAAPPSSAGVANYRLLSNPHIPSGIDAAKIGGGSVSNTEYDRLNGITAFGQSLIDDADASAGRATLAVVIGADVQAFDSDLTTWAGLAPSANAQSLVTAANYAAMRALLDLEAGTDFYSIAAANAAFQPLDSDLTSWAAIARASGFDTFVATPSSGNLRSLISDELGTGSILFGIHANMSDDISCAASQFLRRNASDNGWECATISGGGDALTSNPLSQFAATTSAQLAGVITNELGTDFLVFGPADPNAHRLLGWNNTGNTTAWMSAGGGLTIDEDSFDCGTATDSAQGCAEFATTAEAAAQTLTNRAITPQGLAFKPESFCAAASDESTTITTGTNKVRFRMPYAFTLTAVRASVNTAPVGSTIIIDINENGSTLMTTTKLSIDATETTSTTAASAAVLTDTALADDSQIGIDFDQVGSSTAGNGVKVCLIGHQ